MSAARVAILVGAVMAMDALGQAHGQPSGPSPGDGVIHAVTYVEVMPTSVPTALAILKRYREATRREDGSLRTEVVQRLGEPHEFVVLSVWKDRAAFEAHGKSASATDTRERIAAIRKAPTDERLHTALSAGRLDATVPRGAVYVVTHVDVIPPRKDDGVAALTRLADDSRQHDGNLTFEVVQQVSRPNHFTVVEIWKDAGALEAHGMAPATRRFRDTLAPMSGALYDERKYRAIE